MIKLFPETVLSLSFSEEDGHVLVVDVASFKQEMLTTDETYRTLLGFFYFTVHCLSRNFDAIRNGFIGVLECEGFDWKTNFNAGTHHRIWAEVIGIYPFTVNALKYFHTGLFANLHISMTKKFMPGDLASKIQMGLLFPARLDTFYFVPTRDIANQRVLERMCSHLKTRYEHIKRFKL